MAVIKRVLCRERVPLVPVRLLAVHELTTLGHPGDARLAHEFGGKGIAVPRCGAGRDQEEAEQGDTAHVAFASAVRLPLAAWIAQEA